jgi:hypothetical protein
MKNRYLYFCVVIVSMISCDDIFEKDISGEAVVLRAPADSYRTNMGDVTFSWYGIEGASGYQLTIASPYVDSADVIVLDTVITKTVFKTSIPSGNFQWCVTALNGYYQTTSACHTIVADSTVIEDTNISTEKIVLQSPSDKFSTTETDQILWWEKLDGATQYHVIIASPDVANASVLIADTVITKNTFEISLPVGKSQWCVKGENGTYETAYTCRSIEITK